MMPTGARGPSKLPARRFHRLLFGFSRPIAVAGFDARAFGPDDQERAQITAKLVAALELLQRHAPTRLAALRRDLPRTRPRCALATRLSRLGGIRYHRAGSLHPTLP